MSTAFWKKKQLNEMTNEQWESLCDGCARCCLIKLEDEETGKLHFTNVACSQLDIETCRCTDYAQRTHLVPGCIEITVDQVKTLTGLPATCAYAKLANGESLESWHPLLSGGQESVIRAGISIHTIAVSERHVHPEQLEEHVVDWIG